MGLLTKICSWKPSKEAVSAVFAITNNDRRATKIGKSDCKYRAGAITKQTENAAARNSAVFRFVFPAILSALFLCQDLAGSTPVFGAVVFEVTPAAEIAINADGEPLRFPGFVFYDPSADETYIVDGAKRWVGVYGSDFFPLVSFAAGRGLDKPLGGFVDPNKGMVYICQRANQEEPARISVFNGAFIHVRDIFLDNIPNVPDFRPNQVAVSRDGLVYVAGLNLRGVAVLDNDGIFLRWLRPEDEIFISLEKIAALKGQEAGNEEAAENGQLPEPTAEQQPAKEDLMADIPEEFRPKSKEEKEAESKLRMAPVLIRSLTIDSAGRLYLLSDETSKTYVYNADETFLFSLGAKGGTPRTLSNPRGVAVDEARQIIYVVDYMRHAILAYDRNNGEYLFEFGGKGKGPGWFNFPSSIAVTLRGQVIIADLFNNRVQVIDVKYQPKLPLSQQSQQEPKSTAGAVESLKQAEDTESTGSPDEERGEETLQNVQGAGASDEMGDQDNEGVPLIETRGGTGEEVIQDSTPIETPDADAVPQGSPDEGE